MFTLQLPCFFMVFPSFHIVLKAGFELCVGWGTAGWYRAQPGYHHIQCRGRIIQRKQTPNATHSSEDVFIGCSWERAMRDTRQNKQEARGEMERSDVVAPAPAPRRASAFYLHHVTALSWQKMARHVHAALLVATTSSSLKVKVQQERAKQYGGGKRQQLALLVSCGFKKACVRLQKRKGNKDLQGQYMQIFRKRKLEVAFLFWCWRCTKARSLPFPP